MQTLIKFIFFFLVFIAENHFYSQKKEIKTDTIIRKDDFFKTTSPEKLKEKIILHHSDFFGVKKEKYQGNPFFSGNVRFSHAGSVLIADEVVLYQKENFIRAFGRVKLTSQDGSVITANEMEYDGNSKKGIAKGNVILTDPKQTIKTEKLFYDQVSNTAYFNTGGVITDNQGNTMYTQSATYHINAQNIDFTGNVKIDHPDYLVEGSNIIQNQNLQTAYFKGPTTITDKKNRQNQIYTEQGSFNQSTNEVFLQKNSVIYYNGKRLKGQELYYNRSTGFGTAKNDVTLYDPKERRYIKGNYGEIFQKKDSAMITGNPYAVKILSQDSMFFSAEKFISFQKPDSLNSEKKKSFLRAYRQVRFYKSNAQARADSLSFNETDGVMHLFKKPILWSGHRQVTGDKIEAYFHTENEHIDSLKVLGNAMAISKSDTTNLKDEFDQIKGNYMGVYYKDNQINHAKVIGNAQAITYTDDENPSLNQKERIGVTLSNCGEIHANFEQKRLHIVSCNIGANMDTYPMSFIPKEKRFFPDFNWNTKDRLKKWQDIFINSPNYQEIIYESDNLLYEKTQQKINQQKEKENEKKPKRVRK